HVLRTLPEVDDAAVTVRRPAPDDARLAAFVVAVAGAAPDPESLRSALAGLLPAHLVPDELTVVERLPLTTTGKVDRRALAALDPAAASQAGAGRATPPLTPLQEAVAEVWARSLGCEVASPDDDFLALGGHSLLALVVTDDLREDLGVELSLADFFASPTVAGHAALVERALLAAHTDLHPLPQPSSLPQAPSLPQPSSLSHPDAPEHPDVP
ncbi:phosphopantetheine-binding protein, partial [Streptomyces sp. NPDC054863]